MLNISSYSRRTGFTLIEMMIVIVIAAILVALAIPVFQDTIDRNRLKSVAETLRSDLELMKLESIKRSALISLSIRNDNAALGDWCYGLSETDSCDCKVAASCTIDDIPKVVSNTESRGVIINSPATVSPTPFDISVEQVRNQITTSDTTIDEIRLTSARGKELDIQISPLGRFVICSPSGSSNVPGYPACS